MTIKTLYEPMNNSLSKIDEILQREADPAFARRAKIIFENLNLSGREKILEVGCGRGFYLKTLITAWPDLQVTGLDLNEKYLAVAKKFLGNSKVKLARGDATKLPFKANSFDRIIATEILEHIPDDEKALEEMYRVLKPGGIAMITVPNKNYPFCWDPLNWIFERLFNWHIPANIWWLAGLWADHVRLYTQEELISKITKARFKIEKAWFATHYCLPFSHFLFYGLGKNLVEKGFLKNYNRFDFGSKETFFKKLLLWSVKTVDNLNKDKNKNVSCVNLVFKINREK